MTISLRKVAVVTLVIVERVQRFAPGPPDLPNISRIKTATITDRSRMAMEDHRGGAAWAKRLIQDSSATASFYSRDRPAALEAGTRITDRAN